MSIRLERTPLIIAGLFAVAAVATAFLLPELTYTFIFAGLSVLMLALSLFAGSRNKDTDVAPLTEEDLTPTATFGVHPELGDGKVILTGKEKRAQKAAEKAAQKAAKERAKFEKAAQKEAAKAEKQAAKVEAKRAKAAKKAEKRGHATEEETEAWFAELREQNASADEPAPPPTVVTDPQSPSTPHSPFGAAVDQGIDPGATASPLYEPHIEPAADNANTTPEEEPLPHLNPLDTLALVDSALDETSHLKVKASDITEEIPIVTSPPAPDETPHTSDQQERPENWMYSAYTDETFTPPFTNSVVHVSNEEQQFTMSEQIEADLLDDDLPADVSPIYSDETEINSPAGRLKSWATRLQNLAQDIDHDWDGLMQAYEQRDALLKALEESHRENERLRAELTEKQAEITAGANTKEIAQISSALETAREEVSRLYHDNRELARMQYLNSQTATRLREIRFAVASQGGDSELLALIDEAITESE